MQPDGRWGILGISDHAVRPIVRFDPARLTSIPVRDQNIRRNDLARQKQAVLETHLPADSKAYGGIVPSFDKVNVSSRDGCVDCHFTKASHCCLSVIKVGGHSHLERFSGGVGASGIKTLTHAVGN